MSIRSAALAHRYRGLVVGQKSGLIDFERIAADGKIRKCEKALAIGRGGVATAARETGTRRGPRSRQPRI